MSDRVEAIVNPELLRWARESLGLDIEAAAKKVNVKPAQLQSWERDEKRPTIKQLRKLANVYKRPLAVFYLPAPPRTFDALRDFRRLPGEVAGKESPGLRLQVRRAPNRRQLALELYELLEGTPPNFEVSATISSNPERLGNQIRSLLGISYPEQ